MVHLSAASFRLHCSPVLLCASAEAEEVLDYRSHFPEEAKEVDHRRSRCEEDQEVHLAVHRCKEDKEGRHDQLHNLKRVSSEQGKARKGDSRP